MVRNKKIFGPDQTAINYILYRDGFRKLADDYNMVITMSGTEFKIKNGRFYFLDGKIIPVVHNAGGSDFFRPVKNFGYGKGFNHQKKIIYHILRYLAKTKTKMVSYR